jgi:hypothetical protein
MTTDVTKRIINLVSVNATSRIASEAGINATQRIEDTSTITEDTTYRQPSEVIGLGPFLLLEGDYEGALRLGSEYNGYLKLEGVY